MKIRLRPVSDLRSIPGLIIFCLFSVLISGNPDVIPGSNLEIISTGFRPSPEIIEDYQLDPLMEREGRIFFVVRRDKLAQLKQVLPSFRLESSNFRHLIAAPPRKITETKINSSGGLNGAYHSYSETAAELKNLAAGYPGLARLYVLGQSLEKRNIYALKISNNPAFSENKPALALVGCHHAREWISVEVPLLTAKHLLENYEKNAVIRNIVDRCQIWIIPLLNPDGLDYSILNYRLWRKNRRLNPDGSYGVDLNRNYSYQWGYDNRGSSPKPSSETYRGTAPLSEPETLALSRLFFEHKFSAVISYHSYSQTILYPWGYADLPTEDESMMQFLAEQMSMLIYQVNGRTYQPGRSSSLLYLTNGDFTDWIYGFFKVPAFTVELPPVDFLSGGFFNPESDIQSIFEENLPAVLFLAEWAINNFRVPAENDYRLKEMLEDRGKNLVKNKR